MGRRGRCGGTFKSKFKWPGQLAAEGHVSWYAELAQRLGWARPFHRLLAQPCRLVNCLWRHWPPWCIHLTYNHLSCWQPQSIIYISQSHNWSLQSNTVHGLYPNENPTANRLGLRSSFLLGNLAESLLIAHSIFLRETLQWRHNEHDGVSNHQPRDCLLNRLFRRRSKKTANLRVSGLCAGNSPVTGEFPAEMASNAEMLPFDDVGMKTPDCDPITQTWGRYVRCISLMNIIYKA